ncbi:P-loop containing nucleoside triphosphate hydrolase protein [Xylaria sp. FL1042]|nr:P-loop containing nucleoside triphosphate hydrolase protein [Xylaria sp. FL1042]
MIPGTGTLIESCGNSILKHKSTFKNAIQEIRLRSNRYRVYRKRQTFESEDVEVLANQVQPPHEDQDKGISEEHIQMPGTSESASLTSSPTPMVIDKPAVKKRKIIPTLITTEIDPTRNRSLATEADAVYFTSELAAEPMDRDSTSGPSDNLVTGAYLGSKSVTRFDIVQFDDRRNLETPLERVKELNIVPATRLIPGRMVQTHRLMKRWFLRKTAPRRTAFTKSDIVPGSNNPEHDEVVSMYCDSDDNMEYDSDTWREIEAEQNEKKSKPSAPKGLSAEEIGSTIDRVLQGMVLEWKVSKLPKYLTKANHMWNDARKYGLRNAIDKARRELHELEARIAKFKDIIQDNDYRNVAELERLLLSFEPSVFAREHRLWLMGVLTSPSEPVKISRPRESRERRHKPQLASDDEEILTSDSEDGLNDFIVDDDGPLLNIDEEHTGTGENGSVLPKAVETPSRMRSTGPSKDLQTPSKPTQQPVIIDLTTPPKLSRHTIHYKNGKLSSMQTPDKPTENTASSPLIMGIADLAPGEQKVAIALETVDQTFIDAIFSIAVKYQPEDIWLDLVLPALDREWPKAPHNTHIKKDGLTAYTLIRLFDTYRDAKSYKLKRYKGADDKEKQRFRALYDLYPDEWNAFIGFLKRLSDRFEWNRAEIPEKNLGTSTLALSGVDGEKEMDIDSLSDNADASTSEDGQDAGSLQPGPKKKKRRKRRKEVTRNREAAMVRGRDQAFMAEQESRRKLLRARLETEGSAALGSQHGSIIVNEGKEKDQGFIYINDEIARRIKDHQITGVRFMWDQLVGAKERQGCLLAHTMGLGKTMQVITLLVTIGQASASDDPNVLSQIPEDMRESKTLILCPATLVNNWLDELLSWLPEHHRLGTIFKVDAMMGVEKRNEAIRTWGAHGGIMIIGYNLFKAFINDENIRDIFLEQPNIVIADEAHTMKNPKAKTHEAAANFKTLSRVALTGSPLANNVEEYYSMINWVAPNYLGDIREFRAHYATPINNGLQADSTASDRRRALRMLRVLKSDVSAKVSRITLAVLKNDIPLKHEFVITVPLTPIQRKAYEMFIQYHSSGQSDLNKVPVFAIHDLSLICASPSIFLEKLKDPKSNSADKTESVTLPQQLISDEMALLRSAIRAAKDEFDLCWKVPLLFEILRQCKNVGDKVLLFSHSMVALNYLEGVLRMKKHSFVRLDGMTNMAERQEMVKRFNKGNIDIFLISTKAGALGLNITGANRVVIFDAQFNPQNEQQAVGRAYRIGQKKPVFVYRFVCGGTCEQKILHQAIWKMQLASRVVDKKNFVNKAPRFGRAWDMPEEPEQEELDSVLGKDMVLDALVKDPKYREGIRAVQMMDVFEEEAVEDAEMSAEDINLSDEMIKANKLRRLGLPIPAHLQAALGIVTSNGYSYDIVSSGQPPSGISRGLQSPAQHPSGSQIFVPPEPTIETALKAPIPASHLNVSLPSGEHSFRDLRPPSTLSPLQLPGGEVHIRSPVNHSNKISDIAGMEWDSLLAIQRDLSRAFTINAAFPDKATRSRASSDVSSAIWDTMQRITPEQQGAMKLAIMGALSIERFVEALCMGLISPQRLSQLTPEGIDQQAKAWKEETASEWESRKGAWSFQRPSRDPEHLHTALHRLSVASNGGENSQQINHTKSYRVDDREALQAVFERRRIKTQQKDDQEAVRDVMERRKAKGPPSESSDTGKGPRLPDWARHVVRQAHIPAPSSSVPLSTPPSPKFSLRPQSRTPFK